MKTLAILIMFILVASHSMKIGVHVKHKATPQNDNGECMNECLSQLNGPAKISQVTNWTCQITSATKKIMGVASPIYKCCGPYGCGTVPTPFPFAKNITSSNSTEPSNINARKFVGQVDVAQEHFDDCLELCYCGEDHEDGGQHQR